MRVDSVGGTTYGGTGVYGAQVGGVWDALLGEGRDFWFFASSDWHNRGMFGPDDRRSTQDFYPGEYQRDHVMVRNASRRHGDDDWDDDRHHGKGKNKRKLSPQEIVDGLRSGNSFTATGQLIDRLAFVACADLLLGQATPARDAIDNAIVEAFTVAAAVKNTDFDTDNCATMGEKLVVRPGADIIVSIVVRDPSGTNYSPYSFANPSLAQIGMIQPINMPVLDHIDVIRGMVTGYKNPNDLLNYAGEWPRDWLTNPNMANVPPAAKNTTASVIKTFNRHTWKDTVGDFVKMTFRIPAVKASQYVRLRGTNMPASVPNETDAERQSAGRPRYQREQSGQSGHPLQRRGLPGSHGGKRHRRPEVLELRRCRVGRPVVLQQPDLHRSEGIDDRCRRRLIRASRPGAAQSLRGAFPFIEVLSPSTNVHEPARS